jgi:hypothetical protein
MTYAAMTPEFQPRISNLRNMCYTGGFAKETPCPSRLQSLSDPEREHRRARQILAPMRAVRGKWRNEIGLKPLI